MKDPNIKTEVVHSQSKNAWNVVGTRLGGRYKIARVPYAILGIELVDTLEKAEALNHALFISHCFNNSSEIVK